MWSWDSVSKRPVQMDEPPEWTATIARFIAYEVFDKSPGGEFDEERWIWTCNHQSRTCSYEMPVHVPPPTVESSWLDVSGLSTIVGGSLTARNIEGFVCYTIFIIFFVACYTGHFTRFVEELERLQFERPPAQPVEEAPKQITDWRMIAPPPSRARKPPPEPHWYDRILIALENLDSMWDEEEAAPIESSDASTLSVPALAAPVTKPMGSGSGQRRQAPSHLTAPRPTRAQRLDKLDRLHREIMDYGKEQTKHKNLARTQPSLPANNSGVPVQNFSDVYDRPRLPEKAQATRVGTHPIQVHKVANTIKRPSESRPARRQTFRCPESTEPESREGLTPVPILRPPPNPTPLLAAAPPSTPVSVHAPEPATIRLPTPAPPNVVERAQAIVNPRKRPRDPTPLETEPEEPEPPRKVRKGPKVVSTAAHPQNTPLTPSSIVNEIAHFKVEDLLGKHAVAVDADGNPDHEDPCRGRKDREEWSGQFWRMRVTGSLRERLCAVTCIYPGSLTKQQSYESTLIQVWLTDRYYENAVVHQILNSGSWRVMSIKAVGPDEPVDEQLLKAGVEITRGWSSRSDSHRNMKSTISTEPDSGSSTRPNPDRSPPPSLPSTPPPQPRPLDELQPPPTNIVKAGEESVVTSDTVDDRSSEQVDSIKDNSMDVDDSPMVHDDAMDICYTPPSPAIDPIPLLGRTTTLTDAGELHPSISVTKPSPPTNQGPLDPTLPAHDSRLLQVPQKSRRRRKSPSGNSRVSLCWDTLPQPTPIQSGAGDFPEPGHKGMKGGGLLLKPLLEVAPGSVSPYSFNPLPSVFSLETFSQPPVCLFPLGRASYPFMTSQLQSQPVTHNATPNGYATSRENTQQAFNSPGTSPAPPAFVPPAKVAALPNPYLPNIAAPYQPTQAMPLPPQASVQSQDPAKTWPNFRYHFPGNFDALTVHPGPKKPASRRPTGGSKPRPHWLPGGRRLQNGTLPGPILSSSSIAVPVVTSVTPTAPQMGVQSLASAPYPPSAPYTGAPSQASSSGPLTPGWTGTQSTLPLNGSNLGFTAGPSGTGVPGKPMFGGGKPPSLPLIPVNWACVSGNGSSLSSPKPQWMKHSTPPPPVDGKRQQARHKNSQRAPPFHSMYRVSATPADSRIEPVFTE